MDWINRKQCKDQKQATEMLAEKISDVSLLKKDGITEFQISVYIIEMEVFAMEWKIPFSWDLYEKVHAIQSPAEKTWSQSNEEYCPECDFPFGSSKESDRYDYEKPCPQCGHDEYDIYWNCSGCSL